MNLYIALTPYHIFLTLLHKKRKPGDRIIVIDQYNNFSEYWIDAIKSKAFEIEWYYIDETKFNNFKKSLVLSKLKLPFMARALNEFLSNNVHTKFDFIFVYNDSPVIVQYIISKINTSRVYYIEDGSAPYNNHWLTLSKINLLAKKILFGHFYDWKPVLGTSKHVSGGVFLYKDLIRPENRIYPLFDYEYINQNETIKELSKLFDYNPLIKKDSKYVLILFPFLPPKNDQKKIIGDELIRLAHNFKNNGWSILIKHHPLTMNSQQSFDNLYEHVPQHLPAEALPEINHNIKIVIGTDTTTLSSIKFFYDTRKIFVISFRSDGSSGEPKMNNLYSKTGVQVATKIEDLTLFFG